MHAMHPESALTLARLRQEELYKGIEGHQTYRRRKQRVVRQSTYIRRRHWWLPFLNRAPSA